LGERCNTTKPASHNWPGHNQPGHNNCWRKTIRSSWSPSWFSAGGNEGERVLKSTETRRGGERERELEGVGGEAKVESVNTRSVV
jgi:hypothetical protein